MSTPQFKYPRRKPLRKILQFLSKITFETFTDLTIIGEENIPTSGPLIVVGNHFSFIDPVALVRLSPWPIEFIGGADFPHAPNIVKFIPKIWGYFPVFRGTGSTFALKAAESILNQNGVLGIFPEGGSWAEVLRPPRPGTAFLVARTNAKILPIGLYGLNDIIPLRLKNKPKVTFNIGKPFGPFEVKEKGKKKREQLDIIGHTIMQKIAELLPEDLRGYYSNDPKIREAAKEAVKYPWEKLREGEVVGEIH